MNKPYRKTYDPAKYKPKYKVGDIVAERINKHDDVSYALVIEVSRNIENNVPYYALHYLDTIWGKDFDYMACSVYDFCDTKRVA